MAIVVIDLCPFWLVKDSRNMWMGPCTGECFLQRWGSPPTLKKAMVWPLLNSHHWIPLVWIMFVQSPTSLTFLSWKGWLRRWPLLQKILKEAYYLGLFQSGFSLGHNIKTTLIVVGGIGMQFCIHSSSPWPLDGFWFHQSWYLSESCSLGCWGGGIISQWFSPSF